MKIIKNKRFDAERALYALRHADITECIFAGEADGESALKECRDIRTERCDFSLRYPLWHAEGFAVSECRFEDGARAPVWYSSKGVIKGSSFDCVKAVRECSELEIEDCKISSAEFGWKCRDMTVKNTEISSEYLLFDSERITLTGVRMSGKYSFQYIKDLKIKDSVLDTKDAFWHSENVTVENCTLKGEYLGWFSKGLTLKSCKIIGTQPFCYCEDLRLVDCTMEDTDLSFEYSHVRADIIGHIVSVKNPKSGYIHADTVGEIILEDSIAEGTCEIKCR